MLELYHWEPNAESLALLICLKEKGLAFTGHYVDMLQLEQHTPEYLAKSPKGVVPLLIANGEAMNDCGFALQYLAEQYSEPRLAPTDAADWYDLQAWAAWLGGWMGVNASINLLGWNYVMLKAIPEDELTALRGKIAALPKEPQSGWSAVWSDAEASEDQLANAEERVAGMVTRIEQTLAGNDWLVGSDYSITDITAYAYMHTLPELLPAMVNKNKTPKMMQWLSTISTRDAVKAALAMRRTTIVKNSYTPPGT